MQGQLTIRLNNTLEQQLASLAHRFQKKRSEIVRQALERFIAEEENKSLPSAWQKVSDLAGSVESGVSDLGEEHQKYLRNRFKRND